MSEKARIRLKLIGAMSAAAMACMVSVVPSAHAQATLDIEIEGDTAVEDLEVGGDLYLGGKVRAYGFWLTNDWGKVAGGRIQTDSVGTTQLAADAVTDTIIAADSVGASELKNGAVYTQHLSNDSVTPAKIDETGDFEMGSLGLGTGPIPHGGNGMAMLALEGPAESVAGPHIQTTVSTDNYPVLSFYPYAHDLMNINFDCYFDGTDIRSSHLGSNARIAKNGNKLKFRYANGVPPGNDFTFNVAMEIDLTDGGIKMPDVYSDSVDPNYYKSLYIDHTGKIGYYSSSIRYKENVRDVADGDTEWIHRLRPVFFDYKAPLTGDNKCGLIAEEVAQIHPEIVRFERVLTYPEPTPGDPDPNEDPIITFNDTPAGVEYPDLIVPMLAEVQKLRARVDTLEARLAALEGTP